MSRKKKKTSVKTKIFENLKKISSKNRKLKYLKNMQEKWYGINKNKMTLENNRVLERIRYEIK